MRSIEDKEMSNGSITFEFHKGNGGGSNNRVTHSRTGTGLGKPTPSKWDDAQKWLVGFSRVGGDRRNNTSKTKPRNSNADDTRLIAPIPQQEVDYDDVDEVEKVENEIPTSSSSQFDVHTKNVDCDEGFWRINKGGGVVVESSSSNPGLAVRSVCVRDMGTEMTPIASLEPSRTATPIRATTPANRSPISSAGSTPMRCQHGVEGSRSHVSPLGRESVVNRGSCGEEEEEGSKVKVSALSGLELANKKHNPLETRALAWDEAERAKYMARYKREEVKIQAWENHEKRKAEMEMKKLEVKAERLKSRAQEKYTNKLAATRRIAEEKRANAEAKLSEKAVKTSEKADYIRRTGHLPSSFSIKLPSICWQ